MYLCILNIVEKILQTNTNNQLFWNCNKKEINDFEKLPRKAALKKYLYRRQVYHSFSPKLFKIFFFFFAVPKKLVVSVGLLNFLVT